MKRAFGCLLLLLLLAACQDRLVADVTRFYTLPPPPYNQTFAILPEQGQEGDLEFQHVANLVSGALASYGFRPVPVDAKPPPDFLVFTHYGPLGARTRVIDWGPAFGPYWRRPYYPQYEAYPVFSYFVDAGMLDGPEFRRGEKTNIFQGRAITETGVRDFNVIIPYLVQALFRDFPGVNAQTVRVVVPVQ